MTIRRGMFRVWIVLSITWAAFSIFTDPHPAEDPLLFISFMAVPPLAALAAWLTVAWTIRGFARPDYSDRAAGQFRPLPNADYRLRSRSQMALAAPDLHRPIGTAPETADTPAADLPE
jgi:hypothetical protein